MRLSTVMIAQRVLVVLSRINNRYFSVTHFSKIPLWTLLALIALAGFGAQHHPRLLFLPYQDQPRNVPTTPPLKGGATLRTSLQAAASAAPAVQVRGATNTQAMLRYTAPDS